MTSALGDRLVADYVARLNADLASLPVDRRDEIVGEITSHIAEERAKLQSETESDVRNLLERVGDPAEIAAAAAEPVVTPPARSWGALEIAALILTPTIWPIGVILLWLSPAWNVRDKLIGTLLPPGGYPAVVLFGPALLIFNTSTCSTASDSSGNVIFQSCTGVAALPQWEQTLIGVAAAAGIILLALLPLLVGIYLAIRLQRGTTARRPGHDDRGQVASWSDGPARAS